MTRGLVTTILLFFASTLQAENCPGSRDEWRRWAEESIDKILQHGFTPAAIVAAADTFERCRGSSESPNKSCLANLDRFAKAVALNYQRGHSLGSAVPDMEYYARAPYPGMMEIPPELIEPRFLRWLDRGDRVSIDAALAHINRIAKQQVETGNPELRWIAFVFNSTHLPTPDDTGTMGRLFVYVPGPKFDRFLQFGLRTEANGPQPNGLSLITIDKTQVPPVARLKDFWRKRERGKIIVSTRLKEKGEVAHCYYCHKTPLLPIYPDLSTFDRKRFFAAVREVNYLMRDYGGAVTADIDAMSYGPGLGALDSTMRTPSFLQTCAKGRVAETRFDRLAKAMRCAKCHDGESRGALNFPSMLTPLPTGSHLVGRFVVDHAVMPRGGNDLTLDERHALVDCLFAEQYTGHAGRPGLLRAWLLNEQCWSGSAAH